LKEGIEMRALTIALAMAEGLILTATAAWAGPADLARVYAAPGDAVVVAPARPAVMPIPLRSSRATAAGTTDRAGDRIADRAGDRTANRTVDRTGDRTADGFADRAEDVLTLVPRGTAPRRPVAAVIPNPHPEAEQTLAPLPPAVVAGPVSLLLAGWMARRANRRGGRV
jgi:hypothetical protein